MFFDFLLCNVDAGAASRHGSCCAFTAEAHLFHAVHVEIVFSCSADAPKEPANIWVFKERLIRKNHLEDFLGFMKITLFKVE